jgi:hypothetical protein
MPPALSALSSILLSNAAAGCSSGGDSFGGTEIRSRRRRAAPGSGRRLPPDPTRAAPQKPPSAVVQRPSALLGAAYALFLVGRSSGGAAAPSDAHPQLQQQRRHQHRNRLRRRRPRATPFASSSLSSTSEPPAAGGADTLNDAASDEEEEEDDGDEPLPGLGDLSLISDLRAESKRDITVVTTAALPWMTGTAVNPLLRVIYLARDGHRVNLVVPWVAEPADQALIFPAGTRFSSADEQTLVIRTWAETQVPGAEFQVLYYPAVYAKEFGCILPVGEITTVFELHPVARDVCVLEEPEHLTWHHAGQLWTRLFRLVVGVIHTNYLEYCKASGIFGAQYAFAFSVLNQWVCRSYCHRVIKLSDALQDFPLSVTCNVHGVRDRFLEIGRSRNRFPFQRGAYFLGKVLWAKGYRELINLMEDHYYHSGRTEPLPIDFFGSGTDASAVDQCVRTSPALSRVSFHARVVDHAGDYIHGYKVFVNASQSDVVCTATAEAIAMGKFVVILDHPSNAFFRAFPNCLTYRTPEQFAVALKYALNHEPVPLDDSDAYHLSWEAATERFYDAVRVPPSLARPRKIDLVLANTHSTLSKLYPQPGKDIKRAKSREPLSEPAGHAALPLPSS